LFTNRCNKVRIPHHTPKPKKKLRYLSKSPAYLSLLCVLANLESLMWVRIEAGTAEEKRFKLLWKGVIS